MKKGMIARHDDIDGEVIDMEACGGGWTQHAATQRLCG